MAVQYSWPVEFHGQRSLAGYSSWGHRVGHDWVTSTHTHMGFFGGLDSKESTCSAGDWGSIPSSGRSPGEANGNPLLYSCLENPMDSGAWRAVAHGVAKIWTWLNNWANTYVCTHTHTHTHIKPSSNVWM